MGLAQQCTNVKTSHGKMIIDRISKDKLPYNIKAWPNDTNLDTGTTHMQWHDQQVIASIQEMISNQINYIHGPNLDMPTASRVPALGDRPKPEDGTQGPSPMSRCSSAPATPECCGPVEDTHSRIDNGAGMAAFMSDSD